MRRSIDIAGLSHLAPIPVATRVGPLLTCSITAAYTPGTRDCPESAEAQVANLFHHVGEILRAADCGWQNVAKMTFYSPDPSPLAETLNAAWLAHFPDPASRPSRHTMRVDEDWGDLLLCCDFLAFVGE